jgi:hypothetical protein
MIHVDGDSARSYLHTPAVLMSTRPPDFLVFSSGERPT